MQTVYDEEFFVNHRGKKHKGWESTCLHGIDGMFFKTMSVNNMVMKMIVIKIYFGVGQMLAIMHLKTTEFFKKDIPLKNYRRLRYMLLRPDGYILEHSDTPSAYSIIQRERKQVFFLH